MPVRTLILAISRPPDAADNGKPSRFVVGRLLANNELMG
jgi:hypothetical protein